MFKRLRNFISTFPLGNIGILAILAILGAGLGVLYWLGVDRLTNAISPNANITTNIANTYWRKRCRELLLFRMGDVIIGIKIFIVLPAFVPPFLHYSHDVSTRSFCLIIVSYFQRIIWNDCALSFPKKSKTCLEIRITRADRDQNITEEKKALNRWCRPHHAHCQHCRVEMCWIRHGGSPLGSCNLHAQ